MSWTRTGEIVKQQRWKNGRKDGTRTFEWCERNCGKRALVRVENGRLTHQSCQACHLKETQAVRSASKKLTEKRKRAWRRVCGVAPVSDIRMIR